MVDLDLVRTEHGGIVGRRNFVLHASTGEIAEWLPDNLETRTVSTPGPCFSFDAIIAGGMSGGPIFDREGVYVHGVVSKGLEGPSGPERVSFGSMLAGSMGLPIARMNGASLLKLQSDGNEGMPVLQAPGL